MAKDPAFLFYPGDYIGGTMGMTFEEKGAYIELLMVQFNRGHMTLHMITQVVGQIWERISHKFILDADGLYYNVRLDEEKIKRKTFTESRRNNKNGKNQHTKKEPPIVGHMTSHMEDVNKDVNVSIDNILSSKIWCDQICIKHKLKTHDEVKEWLQKFETHLASISEIHPNESEYKKHFNNWLNKQPKNKTKMVY